MNGPETGSDTPPRQSIRDSYDAIVGLTSQAVLGQYAYVLVKYTFDISSGSPQIAVPEPLYHDIRDENLWPRIVAGTDFWPMKFVTDVVVRGSAYSPTGRPIEEMNVSAKVGSVEKRISVFGERYARFKNGNVWIEKGESFTEIPVSYENAYGGIDHSTPVENADSPQMQMLLTVDHPGLYPRNPFGKGYCVVSDDKSEVELPHLEDPDDLLTIERLVVGDPRRWYLQPLPWCFDWVHPICFPRCVFLTQNTDAWFPVDSDRLLTEVQRGYVAAGFRAAMKDRALEDGPNSFFFQDASFGMIFKDLETSERVIVRGMHPDGKTLKFALPSVQVKFGIEIDGRREDVPTRVHSVVVYPDQEKICIVYGAYQKTERIFIPGIHKHIPVCAHIENDRPVWYQAPETAYEQLKNAQEGRKEESSK